MDKREFGRESVKLHVTLLNSRYRNRSSVDGEDEPPTERKARIKFDGSDILKKFADYDFGETEVNAIHLSQRKTVGDDGYYQSTCVISLNKD